MTPSSLISIYQILGGIYCCFIREKESSTLKIEAAGFSEKLLNIYNTTRRQIPKDDISNHRASVVAQWKQGLATSQLVVWFETTSSCFGFCLLLFSPCHSDFPVPGIYTDRATFNFLFKARGRTSVSISIASLQETREYPQQDRAQEEINSLKTTDVLNRKQKYINTNAIKY